MFVLSPELNASLQRGLRNSTEKKVRLRSRKGWDVLSKVPASQTGTSLCCLRTTWRGECDSTRGPERKCSVSKAEEVIISVCEHMCVCVVAGRAASLRS